MVNRRDPLWKLALSRLLERIAVRVVFVGPTSEPDPKLQRVKKSDVKPMEPSFFEAIREYLVLAEDRSRLWSEVIRPKSDQMLSNVWTRLWKTEEGRRYQTLKAEVDRRKTEVDAICKRAEDGVSRKILASGQVVTFIKTHVLVGRDDLIAAAELEVVRLTEELKEAKKNLARLAKGSENAAERLNILVVEQIKAPTKPKAAELRDPSWVRLAAFEEVQQALVLNAQIEDLIADEMSVVDGIMDEFVATLENLAAEEITPEELESLAPETEEAPAEAEV